MIVSQLVKEVNLMELDPLRVYSYLRDKNTYVLESAEGGEKVARFSFIGINPVATLKIKDNKVKFRTYCSSLNGIYPKGKNPLDVLRNLTRQFKIRKGVPSRFLAGFVGYFSYDLVRYFINLDFGSRDIRKEPDAEFVLVKNNIIFDHVMKKTYVTENIFSGEDPREGRRRLNNLIERLIDLRFEDEYYVPKQERIYDFKSNLTKKDFMDNVEIAKNYIKSGDIFQVVLSQCLSAKFRKDPFEVYKVLKRINPSPYMYFLDFPDRRIAGSSPEMLARVENKKVWTYPIAGTRPRGKSVREDLKLEKAMLADKKERAEHIMLVDLGRNDIGRVARFGSVNVKKLMRVEKYSHVQHIVSEVFGKLRKDKDEFDALKSIFPAGTVSGAPKVRAMEIVDELESTRRGIYAGCVGYFSFNGNMDTAITIRTMIFEKNRAFAQAGAGIVADSKPENEYKETLNKATALLNAISMA